MPARVLLQDFTGVPAIVDLTAMRDAIVALGGEPGKINPLSPVDLVIDHSVSVDHFGTEDALERNTDIEVTRNLERYRFLRWGQNAFDNFTVVPPGTGIVHQVNLEYLARVVFSNERHGERIAYPDTLVGTDSHTTMINGLGVLGWGVGGIEAEAAMPGAACDHAHPSGGGFSLERTFVRWRHSHRSGSHCHATTACPRRRGQVRRVFRPRAGVSQPRRPRDHCQYGARVWRHLRHFSGRTQKPSTTCDSPDAMSRNSR